MKKYIIIFWSVIFLSNALPALAVQPYPQIYKFYMELGKLALDQQDYHEAYENFRRAQMVAPTKQEPAIFINLIKRLQDNAIEPKPATKVFRPYHRSRADIIDEELERLSREALSEEPVPAPVATPLTPEAAQVTGEIEDKVVDLKPAKVKPTPESRSITPRTVIKTKSPEYVLKPPRSTMGDTQNIVYLDDNLWQIQPNTLLRVELRQSIILEANNLKRHLVVTPGFIETEQIDKDRINIVAKRRGSTFVHVWDGTGRWTFNIEVIMPIRRAGFRVVEQKSEEYAEPFKVTYSADWSSYYRGDTLDGVERVNLNYLQRVLLEGETPYGDFDSHVIVNKFDQSTEVTGYGVGLTDGKIGDFEDFSLRGFDIQKVFSPLSMPGQYMRGGLIEAEAFDNRLKYTYVRGRDRAVFGFLAPDVLEKRESYVEGARVTLFPHSENQYSFNFARGFGDAREAYLKDRVYSVEGQHRLMDILFAAELGYDEDVAAFTASSQYDGESHDVTVNLRNIDNEYTTATGLPGGQGEVGGSIFWNWRPSDVNINSYLNLYRERLLPNPEAEDTLNVDYSTSVDVPLSDSDRWRASVYYTDTAGELSPRNSVRFNTNYTKFIPVGDRKVTATVGLSQQRSRFDLSPSSEYDRYSASAGVTVPLVKNMNYFLNYENTWLYEEQSGDHLRPNVLNTGVNYSRKLAEGWSMHTAFSYRDEENTQGSNSFLAGEDSITGSLGTTYRPNADLEFFLDGRTRNVWAEEAGREAFNEIDVRAGIRTAWDMPFAWSPKGEVTGYVFKDLNNNQELDLEEPGIANVAVHIGKRVMRTNSVGYYHCNIRAREVEVKVDIDTIPDGFIFSTPSVQRVEIVPHRTHRVHFGMSTQSGVYGVVFYDRNGNGKPDEGDDFIGKVGLRLDGTQVAMSDFEGSYSFSVVTPGPHELTLDVNTVPIDYLPKIKLKNTIEVSEGSTYIFHIPLEKVLPKDGK